MTGSYGSRRGDYSKIDLGDLRCCICYMDLYGFIWEIKNVVYGKSHVGNPYRIILNMFFQIGGQTILKVNNGG